MSGMTSIWGSHVLRAALLVLPLWLSGCNDKNSNNPPADTPANPLDLMVSVTGSGRIVSSPAGIDCGSDCAESLASGSAVTLNATPSSGFTFSGWSGDCSGNALSCDLTMSAKRAVTATFVAVPASTPSPSPTPTPTPSPTPFPLSVSVVGTGSVTSAPSGINCGTDCTENYTLDMSVTLTAVTTPNSGYTFSGWSGSGITCPGTSTCTVAMTQQRTVSATFTTPGVTTGAPAILFSDLDSGPNTGGQDNQGVFVTIWGKNFGSTQGSITVGDGQVAKIVSWTQGSGNYAAWSLDKVIFQLGSQAASGNIVLTNTNGTSNGMPFTVRAGNIYFVTPNGTGNGDFATPMSPSAAYSAMGPGKTFYFRGGTYDKNYTGGGAYGYRNYSFDPVHGGTAGMPMAMAGYPNETAVFQYLDISRSNIGLSNGAGPTSYVTFANFTLHGGSACFEDGGFYTNPKSGGVGVRLIGNVMDAAYGSANTMTGVILIQNDYWRVLGNEMKNTGSMTAPINNNHGIYNQAGASETEIAWNYFHDLGMGGVIQVHTDPYYVYTNVRIHDNVIAKGTNGNSRGITIGNALSGTYGSIYNNIFDGIGLNFAAIGMGSGDWKVYNNTFHNIYATEGMVFVSNLAKLLGGAPTDWAIPTADIKNNIFYSDGQSPYVTAVATASMSQVTLSNNLYYNFGAAPLQDLAPITGNPLFVDTAAGNFRLQRVSGQQSASPAINAGVTTAPTVTMDHDGVSRPQGGVVDLGAYEQ